LDLLLKPGGLFLFFSCRDAHGRQASGLGANDLVVINEPTALDGIHAVEVIYPRRKPMAIKDLIPWNNRGREIGVHRGTEANPFLTLHREMNRMFDDVFRGFELAPFASARAFEGLGWPQIDVDENDKELRVTAELPGLDEKDVSLEMANGVLSISGEKKSETEDKDRRFSERYYGRFERRIPLEDVDEGKAQASFKNGILTVTIPKSAEAKQNVRRIPINRSS
jgi:HSP20 family protein